MIRVLTIIALCVTILAGSALLYRNQPYSIQFERTGEAKKDQEHVVPSGPPPAPNAFGPTPNVTVVAVPPPVIPEVTPTPVRVIKVKAKHVAAKKLKSKWVVPEEKPFDIKDLFNVH